MIPSDCAPRSAGPLGRWLPARPRLPSMRRTLIGGRLSDRSRLPRYIWILGFSLAAIWAPITGYLTSAPPNFSSHMSLILPGSGTNSSVNLAEIGQASSYANSAFANNSVSPTETYKRLLSADRVLRDAAGRLGMTARAFGKPQVRLVDQTAFIHVKLDGPSPQEAQDRARALRDAFMAEIDRLRGDERESRHSGGLSAIHEYRDSVASTRDQIAQLQEQTGLRSVAQFTRQIDEVDALSIRIDTLSAEERAKTATVQELEQSLQTDAGSAASILRLNSDDTYLALTEAMAEAAAALADAQARFGARHPEVQKAAAAAKMARHQAQTRATDLGVHLEVLERPSLGGRGALLTELVRQETERSGLAAELSALRKLVAQQRARLDQLAPLAAKLEDLQRDFSVAEAVFASAIARSQSSKTDIYASYPLVQVLEDPSWPDDPSSPRRKLAIAAGGAATMLLIFALCLGWVRRGLIEKLVTDKAALS